MNMYTKINKSFENMNKNNNDDFIKEIILNVPHRDMATVAEGLKDSYMVDPTAIILNDVAYNIQLVIMWMPRKCSDTSDMCFMDHHVIFLYHKDEKVCEWADGKTVDEYKSVTIDFRKIQYRINRIVEKDIQEVLHSDVEIYKPMVQYWMTGQMIMTPLVPIPEESLLEAFRGASLQ